MIGYQLAIKLEARPLRFRIGRLITYSSVKVHLLDTLKKRFVVLSSSMIPSLPSFLDVFFGLFNFWGSPRKLDKLDWPKTTNEAMARDWRMVGKDLEEAIDKYGVNSIEK